MVQLVEMRARFPAWSLLLSRVCMSIAHGIMPDASNQVACTYMLSATHFCTVNLLVIRCFCVLHTETYASQSSSTRMLYVGMIVQLQAACYVTYDWH